MRVCHFSGRKFLLVGMLIWVSVPCDLAGGQLRNLAWLQGKCPNGAAIAWEVGRSGDVNESTIKLFEVATGTVVDVAKGWHVEFSPDGSKIAWVSGTAAKGRMRKGDLTIRTIATDINPTPGVHWVSNDAVVVVKNNQWIRVNLDGSSAPVAALTALGIGGAETDVKLRSDETWAWVSGTQWKSSDGKSGTTGGECSSSLSPDGTRVTGLIPQHDQCNLRNIVSGGDQILQRTLEDCGTKGFDNHRWSSNDPRFICAQYECENKFGVWEVATSDVFIVGETSSGEAYGDFTLGSGDGNPWPGSQQPPKMLAEETSLSFTAILGDVAPTPQVFDVYTQSGSLNNVSVGSTPQWLTVKTSSTSGARISVTTSVNTTGLTVGTQTTTVTISSSNAGSISYKVTLTITEPTPPPLILKSPNGNEIYAIDQTMTITWQGDQTKLGSGVEISISVDGGLTFLSITGNTSIKPGTPQWEKYAWKIPTSIEGVSMISSECLVKVEDYNEGSGIRDMSDGFFSIKSATGAKNDLLAGSRQHELIVGVSCILFDIRGREMGTIFARSRNKRSYHLIVKPTGIGVLARDD